MSAVGGGSVRVAEVTLTSAQVKALFSTPIEVVPAPGAGRANLILLATAAVSFVSAAYATNTTLTLGYAGVGLSITGILSATSSKIAAAAGTLAALSYATAQNAAILVSAATADPVTGDSPVTISVYYVTVNLP
jgi:hypothetical protein